MRIRLTMISLVHNRRTFPEGAVVEGVTLGEGEAFAEDEIPLDLAERRVAGGTADLVVAGVTTVSPAASAAIAQLVASTQAVRAASLAFLDAAEAGDASDKLALAEAAKAVRYDLDADLHDRMRAFHEQVDAIQAALDKVDKTKRARAKAGDA